MKKYKKITLITIVGLLIISCTAWFFYNKNQNWYKGIDLGENKPYVLGTEILFENGGNSKDFVYHKDGWGGQEEKFRCTVGKDTIMNLYIKNGASANLKMVITGFGIFPSKKQHQDIEVYANETKVKDLQVGDKATYVVQIPANVMVDNKLSVRLHIPHPYTPSYSNRKLGMCVSSMTIDADRGIETKRKISRWISGSMNKLQTDK